ncbi:presenilins-associated rhomboid-like protein, mitochondrial [Asterias rubens]|uniref:presenilins-associated rhomboid-like protein, mitochondrial n=1 Tax=Asterias rubens TaxID=7604 RepID=UPI001455688A|nr:presenilins-associated rhomboid-like protein, mitochondrial [Asterias rubens]
MMSVTSVVRLLTRKSCVKCGSKQVQPHRFFKREAGDGGRIKTTKAKKKIVDAKFNEKGSLEKFEVQYDSNHVIVPYRSLLKPFGFACLFTGCSFAGAAIWQYEGLRSKALETFKRQLGRHTSSIPKAGELRQRVNQWFGSLSGTEKVTLGIVAANIAVFACWRIPAMQFFMIKWFSASPASSAVCLPMVLSTFSQYSFWHLAVNMYVLWSFAPGIGMALGKEQFLAMYLSSGVWASFASYALKVATCKYHPSLGASGAIMAVLAAVCTQYPDSRLAIVFLPFITFSAGSALKFLIGMESMGVVMGWQFFDHAAHLAGLLCGCYYMSYGHKQIWQKREPLMSAWHKYRGPKEI